MAGAFALVPNLTAEYVWHAGVHAAEVAERHVRIGVEIVSQVIWDKGLFAMGRSWYHWAHEPCWVVRKAGAKVPFLGERNQSTVCRTPSPKMIMGGSTEEKLDHLTQKPVVLFESPISNHLRPGGLVYDPFCWLRHLDRRRRAPWADAATRWRSIRLTSRWRSSAGRPSPAGPPSASMAERPTRSTNGVPPSRLLIRRADRY